MLRVLLIIGILLVLFWAILIGIPTLDREDAMERQQQLEKSHFVLKSESLNENIYQSKRTGRCYLVIWHSGTVELPIEECQ